MTVRSIGLRAATAASIADRSSRLVRATSGVGSGPADPISSPDEVSHSAVERSSWSACPNDENAAARCRVRQHEADRSPDCARSSAATRRASRDRNRSVLPGSTARGTSPGPPRQRPRDPCSSGGPPEHHVDMSVVEAAERSLRPSDHLADQAFVGDRLNAIACRRRHRRIDRRGSRRHQIRSWAIINEISLSQERYQCQG